MQERKKKEWKGNDGDCEGVEGRRRGMQGENWRRMDGRGRKIALCGYFHSSK